MKNLEGYILAKSLEQKEDLMLLCEDKIYFNRADALESSRGKELIFKVIIPIPQDGKGSDAPPVDEKFDMFWKKYPRHIAKKNALKAWNKLKVDDELFPKIMSSLEKALVTLQWQNPQYIPHPATWLNGERWNDEIESGKVLPTDNKYKGL